MIVIKNMPYKKILLTFISFFIILVMPKVASASTLYLSPAGGNIGLGSILNVQVRLNTENEEVNAVSAYLNYPENRLDVAYINYGSAFSIAAEGSYGGGNIRIARGNVSAVKGNNILVATIGFRAKSLGSATVAFIGGSAAPRASDSSDSLNLAASRGGTYTVVEASAIPTPTPVILNISDLIVSDIASNSAIVSWKTNQRSDSTVEVGIEPGKYFLTLSSPQVTTDHRITVTHQSLSPGTKIYYRVKSRTNSGVEAVSEEKTIQLKGYTAKLRITDSQNNPAIGMKVILYSDPKEAVTDTNGEVLFSDVTPGKHLVLIKGSDIETSSEIDVSEGDLSQVQNFAIQISQSLTKQTIAPKINPFYIAGGIVIFVVIIVIIIIMIKRKKGTEEITNLNNPLAPNSNNQPIYNNESFSSNQSSQTTPPTAIFNN